MLPTDLTVAALVHREGRYLIVEERSSGVIVVTQPGGHIESGESPEQAAVRETLEETRCTVKVDSLLGVYLWIHPQTRQQFLRIVYVATWLGEDPSLSLDDGIHAVHWYTIEELKRRRKSLRSPVVLRCIEEFAAGLRKPRKMLANLAPVQKNVDRVIASASLV